MVPHGLWTLRREAEVESRADNFCKKISCHSHVFILVGCIIVTLHIIRVIVYTVWDCTHMGLTEQIVHLKINRADT